MPENITYGGLKPGRYYWFDGHTKLSRKLGCQIKGYRILSINKVNGVIEAKWSGLGAVTNTWFAPVTTEGSPEDTFAGEVVELLNPFGLNPACPYENEEAKKTYLVWRNSGKNRCLMTVEKLEPGDEKYTF